jgi:uncharacterized protein YecT (DUF1311 family)
MLLALAALAAQPIEAGFPCRDARTAQERVVCASPELAAADRELNRRYGEALARLGAAGRRQLRTSQRAWLAFRDSVCPVVDGAALPSGRSPQTCLEARLVQRGSELSEAVRRIGPFNVVRLDGYRVWPAPGRSGWYDEVLTHEERADWIAPGGDSAQRAASARWNARLAARPALNGTRWHHYRRERSEGDPGNDYGGETQTGRELEIVSASPELIVGRVMDYWMGAAHPWEEVSFETMLVPERRSLVFADLVERAEDFRAAAFRRLQRSNPEHRFSAAGHVPGIALSPSSWEPSAEGLVVHYGTVWGRPSGDMVATLRWAEMAPFLSARGRRIAASFGPQAASDRN